MHASNSKQSGRLADKALSLSRRHLSPEPLALASRQAVSILIIKHTECLALLLVLTMVTILQANLRTVSPAPYVHEISLYDADGERIDYEDQFEAQPYSPNATCRRCHDMAHIATGYHFNAASTRSDPGRNGEPWIWLDADTRTQIPLSYRDWPGAFPPDDLGITPWEFTRRFGRHMPGGLGPLDDDRDDTDDQTEPAERWHISGGLEIDCLICHSADPGYNPRDRARQIEKENFKWVATAAAGLAAILGSTQSLPGDFDPELPELSGPDVELPITRYDAAKIETNGRVFFDIVRTPPDDRCYFCHATLGTDTNLPPRFQQDIDIHLVAGMTCSDCHRHGEDHNVVRGYEGESKHSTNPAAGTLTCRACHIRSSDADEHVGRLGAPVAEHKGMPPIHFDVLSCTACHSGSLAQDQAVGIQTALAHTLGLADDHRDPADPPAIVEPVFVQPYTIRQEMASYTVSGKYEPHRLLWPAYWAALDGGTISPLPIATVKKLLIDILKPDAKEQGQFPRDWKPLADEQISLALEAIQPTLASGQTAAYVTGGKVHMLENDQIAAFDHNQAQPYTWPLAHNVRGGAQSLGARSCRDCHAPDAPFHFGSVPVDTTRTAAIGAVKEMIDFQNVDVEYVRRFAESFRYRLTLKILIISGATILAAVLLLFALKAIGLLTKATIRNA